MIISQRCKYALKAVLELSARQAREPLKMQEIAEAQQIPTKFLEAILNDLRVDGIVVSRRGNVGGYSLARPPQDITIGEIIRIVQGPIESLIAKVDPNVEIYGERALNNLWSDVAAAINRVYDTTTFSDLVEVEAAAKGGEPNYII